MNPKHKPSREELGSYIGVFRGAIGSMKPTIVGVSILAAFAFAVTLISIESPELRIKSGFFFTCVVIGSIGLIYATLRFYSVGVYSEGIEGRNYWGMTKRFYWNQIKDLRSDSTGHFRTIVLIQRDTESEIWMSQDIFESPAFQSAVGQRLDRFQRNFPKLEESNWPNRLARRYRRGINILYDLSTAALILGMYFGGAYWAREESLSSTMEYCNGDGMSYEICTCFAQVIREDHPVHSYWFKLAKKSEDDRDRMQQRMVSNCEALQ